MFRPLASFLHRSGIYAYLRRAWREDTSSLRKELSEVNRRLDEHASVLAAFQTFKQTEIELHKRQRDLRSELSRVKAVLAASRSRLFEQHSRALQNDMVAAHATRAIQATTLHETPMPHVVVENVLPDATYNALVDATPPDECFSDRDLIKQNFHPTQGKLAPEFTHVVWGFMEREVIPGVLVPALMSRFKPYIDDVYAQRHGAKAAAVSALPHAATAGRLMLRRPGYHLEPHLDPSRVIVTCLLYIARPGDDTSFGTQLFSINTAPRIEQTKTFYPRPAGYTCTLEKSVAFAPNTAVAFLNAGAGAHGASIPTTAPEGTKRYAYQFYISPDLPALTALTGEKVDEAGDY